MKLFYIWSLGAQLGRHTGQVNTYRVGAGATWKEYGYDIAYMKKFVSWSLWALLERHRDQVSMYLKTKGTTWENIDQR